MTLRTCYLTVKLSFQNDTKKDCKFIILIKVPYFTIIKSYILNLNNTPLHPYIIISIRYLNCEVVATFLEGWSLARINTIQEFCHQR